MDLARQTSAAIDSSCEQFRTGRIKDTVYVESFEAAEETAKTVISLHGHLAELYTAVEAMAEAQKAVAKDIRTLYKGDTIAAPAVKDFIRSTRALAVELPGRMLPSLQKSVVGTCDKWTERLAGVLQTASDELTLAKYKKFRHYKDKVAEMTVEKRSGRMNNSSQKEAYSRNLEKLSAAKGDWFKDRDKAVSGLDKEVLASMDEANKVLLRLVQFSQAFYQQGNDAVTMLNDARETVDNLVKNPPPRTLKGRTEEEEEARSDGSDSSGSEECSDEDSPPKKGKGKKTSTGLSSSNEDSESEEETKPQKSKKEKRAPPKKSKSKKAPSESADDNLDDYVESPAGHKSNPGGLSPRTLEWQRKNEQRVLMGLPPKEHPSGNPPAAAAPDNMLVNAPANSAEDDLLGAFGDLDMAMTPAPQPAATQPAPGFSAAPAANAFAQPMGQQPMMGQPMMGQPMNMMQGQQQMMGQPMNMMGQPQQQTLGQQQQMYNMQQMRQMQQMQQMQQQNQFSQQPNAFR